MDINDNDIADTWQILKISKNRFSNDIESLEFVLDIDMYGRLYKMFYHLLDNDILISEIKYLHYKFLNLLHKSNY